MSESFPIEYREVIHFLIMFLSSLHAAKKPWHVTELHLSGKVTEGSQKPFVWWVGFHLAWIFLSFYSVIEGCQLKSGEKLHPSKDWPHWCGGVCVHFFFFLSVQSSGLQFLFIPVSELAAWSMISCALMRNGFPLEEISLSPKNSSTLWFLYNGISFRLASYLWPVPGLLAKINCANEK